MSWNYRILRHPNESDEEVYGIHQVYYNDAGEVINWTERPSIVGGSIEEILRVLEQIRDATFKPIIDTRDGLDIFMDFIEPITKRFAPPIPPPEEYERCVKEGTWPVGITREMAEEYWKERQKKKEPDAL